MKFKIFFVLGLIFEITNGVEIEKSQQEAIPTTVAKNIWQSHLKKNESTCDKWQKDVEKCSKGCTQVLKTFRGPPADFGGKMLESFKTLKDRLIFSTKCNSTLLSSASNKLLEALSFLKNLRFSTNYILHQCTIAYPKLASAARDIVSNLSQYIGKLTGAINDDIIGINDALLNNIKEYQKRFTHPKAERWENIDFKNAMTKIQGFLNNVTLIVQRELKTRNLSPDVFVAIEVLILILFTYVIGVQGNHSAIASVIYFESDHVLPSYLLRYLQVTDPLLQGITGSIANTTCDVKSIKFLLADLVDQSRVFNNALDGGREILKGVQITKEEIKKKLSRS